MLGVSPRSVDQARAALGRDGVARASGLVLLASRDVAQQRFADELDLYRAAAAGPLARPSENLVRALMDYTAALWDPVVPVLHERLGWELEHPHGRYLSAGAMYELHDALERREAILSIGSARSVAETLGARALAWLLSYPPAKHPVATMRKALGPQFDELDAELRDAESTPAKALRRLSRPSWWEVWYDVLEPDSHEPFLSPDTLPTTDDLRAALLPALLEVAFSHLP